ncbi:hypothetical protein AAFF_G00393530 [Aldrovandia affinis]|uniref:Uncharacterized protein n=1 Tax=Aldrovandia affinis TaxID=143900 RepID=A0AAD7SDK7_9TELE|nr:hypothetical protein AAFF_G00393530 [Aldrovandia affinis]
MADRYDNSFSPRPLRLDPGAESTAAASSSSVMPECGGRHEGDGGRSGPGSPAFGIRGRPALISGQPEQQFSSSQEPLSSQSALKDVRVRFSSEPPARVSSSAWPERLPPVESRAPGSPSETTRVAAASAPETRADFPSPAAEASALPSAAPGVTGLRPR